MVDDCCVGYGGGKLVWLGEGLGEIVGEVVVFCFVC